MLRDFQRARVRGRGSRSGFALVGSLAVMIFLALAALGMLSLSTFVVREASHGKHAAEARANARLALMIALGELQTNLGPDQRVSAAADLLHSGSESGSSITHPHWTAVWSSTRSDGSSHWVRDDANGGLRDLRGKDGWKREDEVLSYLVSGNEGALDKAPLYAASDPERSDLRSVELVREGSVGSDLSKRVRVPLVDTRTGPGRMGRYAFWIGDLGVRANVATRNRYKGTSLSPAAVGQGGYHQLLASQGAASSLIGSEGLVVEEEEKTRVIDGPQLDLLSKGGRGGWRERHFHDLTVASQGLLTDVREGGLKKDLTAFLEGEGKVDPLVVNGGRDSQGLKDSDNLVGPRNEEHAKELDLVWEETRHRMTAPRFGLLRDWMRLGEGISLGKGKAAALPPKSEETPNNILEDPVYTTSNFSPAAIASMDRSNLAPVLVEASLYWNFSNYRTGGAGKIMKYNVRRHTYPRVVLWNPYNIELDVESLLVMLQSNGRHETLLDIEWWWGTKQRYETVWWNDGRADNFSFPAGSPVDGMSFNEPYIGSMVFSVPRTKMAPGECLVFSAAKGQEYDYENLGNNMLSCTVGPDVSRGFWHSNQYVRSDGSTTSVDYRVLRFWIRPNKNSGNRAKNQAEDQRVIVKSRGLASQISFPEFDQLPQISYASCSLQYGAGRELRLNTIFDHEVETTDLSDPKPTFVPDVRMREGIRLRWFEEHESNLGASGGLSDAHFEEGIFANWNLRGAYALRSPYENVAGTVAADGSGGGPWYFGAYTRDLPDDSVSWEKQEPVLARGRYHGNPFGTPQEGQGRPYVLFDVPRKDVGIVSMGQFQHLKLSEFVWHPSYAFGNSLVDPRLGEQGMTGTSPATLGVGAENGGWVPSAIGWSGDRQRSSDSDQWARFGRAMFQEYPKSENLVYDLSYEVNHSLWDPFFLSSGNEYQKRRFVRSDHPLPNGRMVVAPTTRASLSEDRLGDYHHAAYHLMVDGAFNVNSTSVEAWKAVLGATRDVGMGSEGSTVVSRLLNPPNGEWRSGDGVEDAKVWSGFRSLDDAEVGRLAEEIVKQVRARGPFLSVADFVNRRLSVGEEGKMGALQAAIEGAELNRDFRDSRLYGLRNEEPLGDYSHPDNIKDSTRMEQTLKPDSKAWGATTYVTQADLLQVLGPMISARSDTFVIRSYGEALDGAGKVMSRAWCEAVVQRIPEPVDPDDSGLNSRWQGQRRDFGRRFVVKSFRWLHPDEV